MGELQRDKKVKFITPSTAAQDTKGSDDTRLTTTSETQVGFSSCYYSQSPRFGGG